MLKLVLVSGIVALLAACSTTGPVYSAGSLGVSSTATAGPPRSPGEGPAFNPYYGGGTTAGR
jgi:hypothetical protein